MDFTSIRPQVYRLPLTYFQQQAQTERWQPAPTDAQKLFLGDGTFLGGVVATVMGAMTAGIGTVYHICELERQIEAAFHAKLAENTSNANQGIVAHCNADELAKIKDIIIYIKAHLSDIIEAIKKSNNDQSEYFSVDRGPLLPPHISVKDGMIYWREFESPYNLAAIPLMPVSDFYRYCANHEIKRYANLEKLDFRGIDLSNRDLGRTKLNYTDLSHAQLNGANFDCVEIAGTIFTDATFDGDEPFTLYLTSTNTYDVLMAIDTIDNKYSPLKLELINQCWEHTQKWLAGDPRLRAEAALIHIYRNTAGCAEQQKITQFVDTCIQSTIKSAQSSVLTVRNPAELFLVLQIVENTPNIQHFSDSFKLQLLALGMGHSDKEINTVATRLYQRLLNLWITQHFSDSYAVALLALGMGHSNEKINTVVAELYQGFMNQPPMQLYKTFNMVNEDDSSTDEAAEALLRNFQATYQVDTIAFDKNQPAFVFIGENNNNNAVETAMIVSKNQLVSMLVAEKGCDWSKPIFCSGGEPIMVDIEIYDELYRPFPLVYQQYKASCVRYTTDVVPRLMDAIFAEPTWSTGFFCIDRLDSYKPWFTMAFSVAFMDDQYELVNDKHQKGLGDIFNPLMDKDGITSEHFKQIGQIFEFSAMGKTAQGQFCICLAVLMTNLTTNNFFGADSKSPIVLRDYAVALLNTANKLDATLFLDMKQTSVLPDWKRKLKSDKCSNLLKNTMTSHIEYKGFTFVLNTMKPPKWKF